MDLFVPRSMTVIFTLLIPECRISRVMTHMGRGESSRTHILSAISLRDCHGLGKACSARLFFMSALVVTHPHVRPVRVAQARSVFETAWHQYLNRCVVCGILTPFPYSLPAILLHILIPSPHSLPNPNYLLRVLSMVWVVWGHSYYFDSIASSNLWIASEVRRNEGDGGTNNFGTRL